MRAVHMTLHQAHSDLNHAADVAVLLAKCASTGLHILDCIAQPTHQGKSIRMLEYIVSASDQSHQIHQSGCNKAVRSS